MKLTKIASVGFQYPAWLGDRSASRRDINEDNP